jgi:hypothetical protein
MNVIRNITFKAAALLATIALLGLSGCAHYRAKSLNRLTTGIEPQNKKSVISFAYQVFDTDDCLYYLDRDVIAKGYQPVHITFTNNTSHHLNFSTEMFSFPCASIGEVAADAHTNTTARAVGYGVGGIFIWPLLIPAIVDSMGSAKANKKLNADFSRKGLRSQLVPPSSSINGLIFVPVESFDSNFSFVVTDMKNNQRYELSTGRQLLQVSL